jgi:hypothetical protein
MNNEHFRLKFFGNFSLKKIYKITFTFNQDVFIIHWFHEFTSLISGVQSEALSVRWSSKLFTDSQSIEVLSTRARVLRNFGDESRCFCYIYFFLIPARVLNTTFDNSLYRIKAKIFLDRHLRYSTIS